MLARFATACVLAAIGLSIAVGSALAGNWKLSIFGMFMIVFAIYLMRPLFLCN